MGRAASLSPEGLLHEHSSQMLGVAACSRFGKAGIHVENGLAAALHGRPRFLDDELAFIARDQSAVVAVAHGWLRFGEKLPTLMQRQLRLRRARTVEEKSLSGARPHRRRTPVLRASRRPAGVRQQRAKRGCAPCRGTCHRPAGDLRLSLFPHHPRAAQPVPGRAQTAAGAIRHPEKRPAQHRILLAGRLHPGRSRLRHPATQFPQRAGSGRA